MEEQHFIVRRSKFSLIFGFVITELLLLFFLFLIVYAYLGTVDDPRIRESLHFPRIYLTYSVIAVYLHFYLLMGLFFRLSVSGSSIELRRFLRKRKFFNFSDIQQLVENKPGQISKFRAFDLKIIGKDNKTITYLKFTDRNYKRFTDAYRRYED